MNLIVAVDKNWGIGKDNDLLVSIPEDMKFFKNTTTGHVVVMGRKTLESFPKKKPLPNRTNIVLTRDDNYEVENAIVVHSREELLEAIADYNNDEVFVIGGASIYKQLLSDCSVAYVTHIEEGFEADTFFPNLDESEEWKMVDAGEMKEHKGIQYRFTRYEK